ncbi:hypothetical protein BaRGS_00016556 [Batillaria attramentaria]|uniref:Group XV phospholipase A2 n=1 Tax=Batillaria attramentaria TaxID=370345 RepID=A0ABD0KYK1_9CAEN
MATFGDALHFSLTAFVILFAAFSAEARYPVIFVPGDGGSQLWAKLNRTDVPHEYCKKVSSDYFNIWLNLEELVPLAINCFVDNMRLHYDNKTRTTHDTPGVDIRIKNFGDPQTVEWLDPDSYVHYSALAYFSNIAEALVNKGYTRGKDLKGAPYDFRRAPNELGELFVNLTKLVEDTYAENNNTRVVMVAHSMGNPVLLYFFNHKPQSWKDKFIQAHVSISGVWAGSVKPVRLMTSGDSLGVVIVEPNTVRPEQRSMPSSAWLMPSTRFWSADEVLVITDKRNYTSRDYKQLFIDIDFMDGYDMWLDTQKLIIDLTPPGVEVHCLHGLGINTPGVLQWGPGQFPDAYPKVFPDDGDGTVPRRSLEACTAWTSQQKQAVKHSVFKTPEAEHMAILKFSPVIDYVVKVATGS